MTMKNNAVRKVFSKIPGKLADYLRLDKTKEESIIRACKENDISFLGLFGSYARGDQKEQSDVDFLASFSRRKSLLDLVRIERDLSGIIGIKVDLVTEKSLSPYLIERIKSEVKPIYYEG
ncbi:MAG TPA: nucleotidyltransferase family protein [candidate division Zixibacteria bacterium]|nr:nucleotidyltransferase family protein [candidate division Zixibacteria bacterium]